MNRAARRRAERNGATVVEQSVLQKFVYFGRDARGGVKELFSVIAVGEPPPEAVLQVQRQMMAKQKALTAPRPAFFTVQVLHPLDLPEAPGLVVPAGAQREEPN